MKGDIEGCKCRADALRADLMELALARLLRALVAIEPSRVEEPDGEAELAAEIVLDERACDGRRSLGSEAQRPAAAVGERVHLLVENDLRCLAECPEEHVCVLEGRRLDATVSVPVEERAGERLQRREELGVGRIHVGRAARRLRVSHQTFIQAPDGLFCSNHEDGVAA